jgi:hypothetical protein
MVYLLNTNLTDASTGYIHYLFLFGLSCLLVVGVWKFNKMIKANELRIGNYLQGDPMVITRLGLYHNGVTKITGFGISAIESGNITSFSPIPLTPEILENSDFKKVTGDNDYQEWRKEFVRQFDDKIQYVLIGRSPEDPEGMYFFGLMSPVRVAVNNIYHLHQLQNLHFALTGQELKINL